MEHEAALSRTAEIIVSNLTNTLEFPANQPFAFTNFVKDSQGSTTISHIALSYLIIAPRVILFPAPLNSYQASFPDTWAITATITRQYSEFSAPFEYQYTLRYDLAGFKNLLASDFTIIPDEAALSAALISNWGAYIAGLDKTIVNIEPIDSYIPDDVTLGLIPFGNGDNLIVSQAWNIPSIAPPKRTDYYQMGTYSYAGFALRLKAVTPSIVPHQNDRYIAGQPPLIRNVKFSAYLPVIVIRRGSQLIGELTTLLPDDFNIPYPIPVFDQSYTFPLLPFDLSGTLVTGGCNVSIDMNPPVNLFDAFVPTYKSLLPDFLPVFSASPTALGPGTADYELKIVCDQIKGSPLVGDRYQKVLKNIRIDPLLGTQTIYVQDVDFVWKEIEYKDLHVINIRVLNGANKPHPLFLLNGDKNIVLGLRIKST